MSSPPSVSTPRLFWLANALTLVRVPMALALWLFPGDTAWMLAWVVAAGLTDVVDGRLARWAVARPGVSDRQRRAQARLGAWLDSGCDKLFMMSAVGALFYVHRPPWHLALLVVSREILLVPLMLGYAGLPRAWRHTHPLTADWAGKGTTGVQVLALLALLFHRPAFESLAWACAALGTLAVVRYFQRVRGGPLV